MQLRNEDTKITDLSQMDEDNKSVVNYGPKSKSDDQSDCSLNVARVSISYDPSTTMSDKVRIFLQYNMYHSGGTIIAHVSYGCLVSHSLYQTDSKNNKASLFKLAKENK